ncbi:hypothetical protein [Streptomyces sp. NBC_00829]|uniref:hypothetical protein n=1 Tax=Streptomyces sp. NBC_00829 TaxID=2903679 RepID=UPI003867861F|nr:hypothetical protein OG293_00990 [Streptomyces sp. NBC_00829]
MFTQVIQGQVSDTAALRARLDRWQAEVAAGATGWLGSTGGVTSDGTFVGVVRFESAEAAQHNSDRPEQSAWWAETSKLFTGEVTFHNCREVLSYLQGGSDHAGFVQIMQGRVSDPARFREMYDATDEGRLAAFRPDLIGGTVGLHGDGGFTEAVYFASEKAAREGEQKEPPADMKEEFEQMMSLMQDVTYFDLPEPWLRSPR